MPVKPSEPPLVSIIIPTCNRLAILKRCLEALARQDYPNLELVIIDDCSTDGTPDYLQSFAANHPRLQVCLLRNDHNLGANASRNRGIQASQGPFVAFIDSDCIAEPEWITRLMAGFVHDRVAAVSGLVIEPPPRNIYELTFKGTHRLHCSGPIHRLIAGNLCVRRPLLIKHRLDEERAKPDAEPTNKTDFTLSGLGVEEGLYLRLKAAGHEMHCVIDAVVLHDHPLNAQSLIQQAIWGGRSAGRLVYRYYLPPRLDLVPFLLAYLTLPLILIGKWWALIPLFFFLSALAAVTYNDIMRKGKTIGETIRSFPFLLVYYHVRLAGYVWETLRQRLSRHRVRRVRLCEIPSDFSAEAALGSQCHS